MCNKRLYIQCIKVYINKAVKLHKAQICNSFCQNLNKLLFCQETRDDFTAL